MRGKSLERLDPLRPGVLRDAFGGEELLQLVERRRELSRLGDDRRARALAHALVGHRHDRHLVDRRVAQDHGLDLGRHDRHAAAADDVLAAADEQQVAVRVERAEVAGPVAAPVGQRLARQLLVVEEAEEAARAVDDDPAELAGRQRRVVRVEDPDLASLRRAGPRS